MYEPSNRVKDPPNFRRGSTKWGSCHFCVHMADNDRRFSCLAYECFVLLDTICDSYEKREGGDPPIISRYMREVPCSGLPNEGAVCVPFIVGGDIRTARGSPRATWRLRILS